MKKLLACCMKPWIFRHEDLKELKISCGGFDFYWSSNMFLLCKEGIQNPLLVKKYSTNPKRMNLACYVLSHLIILKNIYILIFYPFIRSCPYFPYNHMFLSCHWVCYFYSNFKLLSKQLVFFLISHPNEI